MSGPYILLDRTSLDEMDIITFSAPDGIWTILAGADGHDRAIYPDGSHGSILGMPADMEEWIGEVV